MIHLRRLRANDFKQLRAIDLVFPRRGSILVQGSNEAGKSTLFEAVFVALFGRPLDGKRLDDLIRHGAEEAYLQLEIGLPDGRELAVTRRLRRTRSVYAMELRGPGDEVEELRGASVIAARIEAELGFDGDAMLDTCFVEQKKLDKLEGMSLRDRERSLLKLLNLDRLQALSDELKVSRDDERQLERLATRRDLARVQARLPELEQARRDAGAALARAETRDALEAAAEERRALATLAAESAQATTRATGLAERAATVDAAREGLRALEEGRTELERAAEAAAARDAATTAADEARAAAVQAVAVTARGKRLKRIRDRLQCMDRLASERAERAASAQAAEARLRELAELREQLNDTRRALVEARGKQRDATHNLEDLSGDLAAFDVRDALADWRAAQAQGASLADPAPHIAVRSEAKRDVIGRAQLQLGVLAATAVAGLAGGAWLRAATSLPGWAGLLLLALGALALLLLATRGYGAWRRLDALTAEIARLEGEATVLSERRAALRERSMRAAARLAELRASVPADLDRADESLAALDARIKGRTRAEVERARDGAAKALAEAGAALEVLGPREAQLQQAAGPHEARQTLATLEKAAARVARIERFLERRRPRLAALAEEADVALETGALDHALGGLRAELQALKRRAAEVAEHQAAAARHAATRERRQDAARAAWRRIPEAHRPESEVAPDAPDAPAALPPPDAWQETETRLRGAFEEAGGEAVRRAHEQAARAAAGLAARHEEATTRWAQRLSALRARLAPFEDQALLETPLEAAAADDFAAAARELAAGLPAQATTARLAERRDRAQRELDVAQHERARLERALDLRGEVLDLDACAAALAETARRHDVQRRARAMLEVAGRRVVQQVMPSTIEHMRRLLPTLTAGRYFDAQLSEDYRIEVYDERAGDWLRKNLFSGGTRDQFSLALRLAFALATLPDERGVAPGFLFLDEPLGAFDDERAGALIALLTEGEVAESFDQVFLISHVRVEGGLFDYRIELEGGRVVGSSLPVGVGDVGDAGEEGDTGGMGEGLGEGRVL